MTELDVAVQCYGNLEEKQHNKPFLKISSIEIGIPIVNLIIATTLLNYSI